MKPTRRPSVSSVTETGIYHMNLQSPPKSAVVGSSSSLPLLVSEGGGLVCESVGKANLLSDHFNSK